MKKVNLLTVGKIKEKYLLDGIGEYQKRLGRFCDFNIIEVADSPLETAVKTESGELIKKMEGCVILLDIGGKEISSPELAAILDKSYANGFDNVTFIIGGSYGVSEELKTKADYMISFGKITYPHQLMRLITVEQIYRAFTITAGLPYHK